MVELPRHCSVLSLPASATSCHSERRALDFFSLMQCVGLGHLLPAPNCVSETPAMAEASSSPAHAAAPRGFPRGTRSQGQELAAGCSREGPLPAASGCCWPPLGPGTQDGGAKAGAEGTHQASSFPLPVSPQAQRGDGEDGAEPAVPPRRPVHHEHPAALVHQTRRPAGRAHQVAAHQEQQPAAETPKVRAAAGGSAGPGCHPGTPAHPPLGQGGAAAHPHTGRALSERLCSRADIPPGRPFCFESVPRVVWGKSFHFSCWCVRCQATALTCCISGLPSAPLCPPAKWCDVSGAFLGADLPDVADLACMVSPGTLQPLGWPGSQSLTAQGCWRRQLGEAGARSSLLCSALLPRHFPSLSSSLESKHQSQRQPLPRAQPAQCPATSTCCSLRCSVPLRSSVRTTGRAAAPRCRGLLLQPPGAGAQRAARLGPPGPLLE